MEQSPEWQLPGVRNVFGSLEVSWRKQQEEKELAEGDCCWTTLLLFLGGNTNISLSTARPGSEVRDGGAGTLGTTANMSQSSRRHTCQALTWGRGGPTEYLFHRCFSIVCSNQSFSLQTSGWQWLLMEMLELVIWPEVPEEAEEEEQWDFRKVESCP